MSRLSYDDSPRECIVKMCDGNPGAVGVLVNLVTSHPDGFVDLHRLDDAGIYGPAIWVLYKDACGENLDTLRGAIRDGTARGLLEAEPRLMREGVARR